MAIMGVIINHWMTAEQRGVSLAAFHVMQAVPVFFLLMGYNASNSFDRRSAGSLGAIYRSEYLRTRLVRLLMPLAILVAISIPTALAQGIPLYFGPESLLLHLPRPIPGQFFVAVSVAFVFLLPLVNASFKRAPRVTIAACAALSLAYELLTPFKHSPAQYYIYQANPLRFVALVALGFWLASEASPTSRRNWFFIPAAIASAAFLAAYARGLRPGFVGPEYMYNVLAAGWPLLLTACGLTFLPRESQRVSLLGLGDIGRASYHIFLVQGMWFGGFFVSVVAGSLPWLVASLVVCCGVGLAWYRLDQRILTRRASHTSG
jgi:peptidoglycan/LPS O-acetylase OafA/YrhL